MADSATSASSDHQPEGADRISRCLTDDEVVDYLTDASQKPGLTERVETHLTSCSICGETVAALRAVFVGDGEPLDKPDEGLIRTIKGRLAVEIAQ